MSVCRTRCIAAFRLSVPERAWLTSSSVERRRASRAEVDESGPERAAGMSGLLHSQLPPARLGACGRRAAALLFPVDRNGLTPFLPVDRNGLTPFLHTIVE